MLEEISDNTDSVYSDVVGDIVPPAVVVSDHGDDDGLAAPCQLAGTTEQKGDVEALCEGLAQGIDINRSCTTQDACIGTTPRLAENYLDNYAPLANRDCKAEPDKGNGLIGI